MGNPSQDNTNRTQRRGLVLNALERIRNSALHDRSTKFTALLHHVTVDLLHSSYRRIRPKAAAGVDGTTWYGYGKQLQRNLEDLHDRVQRGAYRAKPTRRVFIPKADGRLRPLGIAALEDKVLQGAVAEVLNSIYEVDFLGFSYGFRPRRGAHDALDALAVGLRRKKVNWVLDADIRGFFDVIDHSWMIEFLKHRIGDKRVLRLIQKWLGAGVLEDGKRTRSDKGTPQGATISPLLANVYLHYSLDLWVNQWRKRYARGDVIVVRYADDFAVGFQYQNDAERFHRALVTRLKRFSLELHAEKTRLIEFGRFATQQRRKRGLGKPDTFSFLGLRHVCKTTKNGKFLISRVSDAKRMRAKLREIKTELRRRMHLSIDEQGAWLRSVLTGYYNYHAVPTNSGSLCRFRTQVTRLWLKSLRRRSQRHRLTWKRMSKLEDRWIPRPPRNLHPWPEQRFDVKTHGRSPVR